ncbi:hypothetical protein DP73_21175 [Desulfosporosinus sp. HMP52]|uniref:DNA-primase RepB domain-containing protein n=1 Tax=Desulfosporosinus sp. HMP52 TaxID=1487923 RepID=UPI00051FACF6|nr:DNA-primase RepB domain-containing protein [Desulfosporosinus sp. HMP52]KGK81783.1 hypothetical protein DP73_21175 [Desulfosporosinus sp. HMP52]
MISTEQFFEYIFGTQHIRFRCLLTGARVSPIDSHGYFNQETISLLQQANEQNREIYYVINTGGYKNDEITKINAVFVDLDCGRDENGDYYPLDIVSDYKKDRLSKLSSFIYKPTFIVNTRNGFQAIWALQDDATIEQFNRCESRLIKFFAADERVKKLAQLLRAPGFTWCKDINNKYFCDIEAFNDVRYNIQDILERLSEYVETPAVRQSGIARPDRQTYMNTTNNVDLIRSRDIEGLQRALDIGDKRGMINISNKPNSIFPPFTQVIVPNRKELYDYIFKMNLVDFLGLSSPNHQCLFHDDNTPSASIYNTESDGHFLYTCHSSNCDFNTGNIIKCVERIQSCNKPQAINFLKKVYGLEIEETEWQKEQKDLLQVNKDYLYSNLLQVEYPDLFKVIRYYVPLLHIFNDFAMNHIYDEPPDNIDKVIFFCAYSHLKKISGVTSVDKLNKRIKLLVFLGLIETITEEMIPKRLREEAIRLKIKAGNKSIVSFYSIPSYSDHVLSQANQMAKIYKDNHMTIVGMSCDLIYRNFGEEAARRVYTQKNVKPTQKSRNFETQFDKVLISLIEENGYATQPQIIEVIGESEHKLKPMIKRVLNESLQKYGLTMKKSNKELNLKYGLSGYRHIIIPHCYEDKKGGIFDPLPG